MTRRVNRSCRSPKWSLFGLWQWGSVCCTEPESQQGGSQIRLQRAVPASKAVLQFVAADILEPVGQQNGESTEMYQLQNTLGVIYGASFVSSTERPDSRTGSDRQQYKRAGFQVFVHRTDLFKVHDTTKRIVYQVRLILIQYRCLTIVLYLTGKIELLVITELG